MITLVVPTYNEKDNIEKLVKKILENKADIRVLIIDDNSPDGTGQIADRLSKKHRNVSVIHRKNERGLGSAIKLGIEKSGDIVGVIDGDLSHDPAIIGAMIREFRKNADFVIGSRYVRGGGIDEWGIYRRIVSKTATFAVRPLTHVKDPLSGFFFIRKSVVKNMKINPESCKICLDILVRGNYTKVVEVPYIFMNRKFGKSKILNMREMAKYAKFVCYLYCHTAKKWFS